MTTKHARSSLLTPKQAATYLSVSPGTLANWRYRNEGPDYVKLGSRCVRYRPTDLELWLTSK
ncbi:helix-turn-helix transcriptional regulator [Streptomyces sp. O3]